MFKQCHALTNRTQNLMFPLVAVTAQASFPVIGMVERSPTSAKLLSLSSKTFTPSSGWGANTRRIHAPCAAAPSILALVPGGGRRLCEFRRNQELAGEILSVNYAATFRALVTTSHRSRSLEGPNLESLPQKVARLVKEHLRTTRGCLIDRWLQCEPSFLISRPSTRCARSRCASSGKKEHTSHIKCSPMRRSPAVDVDLNVMRPHTVFVRHKRRERGSFVYFKTPLHCSSFPTVSSSGNLYPACQAENQGSCSASSTSVEKAMRVAYPVRSHLWRLA